MGWVLIRILFFLNIGSYYLGAIMAYFDTSPCWIWIFFLEGEGNMFIIVIVFNCFLCIYSWCDILFYVLVGFVYWQLINECPNLSIISRSGLSVCEICMIFILLTSFKQYRSFIFKSSSSIIYVLYMNCFYAKYTTYGSILWKWVSHTLFRS